MKICGKRGEKKMKLVINGCYGGFSLSREAVLLGRELSGDPEWGGPCIKGDKHPDGQKVDSDYGGAGDLSRHDETLVKVVKKLGKKAGGNCSALEIVEVPDGLNYTIEEYNGNEWVAETHRTWR